MCSDWTENSVVSVKSPLLLTERTQIQTNIHTLILYTCVYIQKINTPAHRNTSAHAQGITPNHCVNTVTKQTHCTLTQTAHLIAASIYCSHHTNLYKTEGLLQQDQRKCVFSLRVRDLKETGAFYSHASQLRRVCCLI